MNAKMSCKRQMHSALYIKSISAVCLLIAEKLQYLNGKFILEPFKSHIIRIRPTIY